MRNYWVISPNVKNNDEEEDWIKFISKNPYSFIGWKEDNKYGQKFIYKINKGDIVINAQRKDWKPNVYGIGVADSDAIWDWVKGTPSEANYRKLKHYISKEYADKLNLDFTNTAYYGGNRQIPALYMLHPERNDNDKKLVEIIERALMIQPCINLLEGSKNLIFTGAPGTGKTYLAKEIAKQIIGVQTDEELKNSEQFEFVQFHPSYDYTDFVEGLRPTKPDENGNIGFELKDGVFKRFCQIARKNFEDSQKPKDQLERELSLETYLSNFINHINEVIESDGKYPLIGVSGKSIAPIVEIDERNFKTRAESGNILSTALVNIIEKYESYAQERDIDWTFNVVQEKLKTTYHSSYFFAFVKAFDDYISNHQLEIAEVNEVQLKPYIIIIDEINRGEISKIFGELFFSIDPSYRGVKGAVKTQYANLHMDEGEVFYIPENVYIIGTMNDIDRSVESFDFAMRRRFVWQEISAEDSAINMNLSEQTRGRMDSLNLAISKIDVLNSSYHIGGAYFLDKDGKERTDYHNIWQLRLEPLLKEYLRGIPNNEVYLEELKASFNQENLSENNGQ